MIQDEKIPDHDPDGLPNRYGLEGDNDCMHSVMLYKVCKHCNSLLAWIADPSKRPICAPMTQTKPSLPNLVGTGDLMDPLLYLAKLGEGAADTAPPGGGSIRA